MKAHRLAYPSVDNSNCVNLRNDFVSILLHMSNSEKFSATFSAFASLALLSRHVACARL